LKLKVELKKFEQKITEEKNTNMILNDDSYDTKSAQIWYGFYVDIKYISDQINLLQNKIKNNSSKNSSN